MEASLLRSIGGTDAAVFRMMYDAYLEELVASGAKYARDARGVWQPDLVGYWLGPTKDTDALLLALGEEVIGFACVGHRPFPYMSGERDHALSEFYVRPEFRYRGLGKFAAFQLFDRFAGEWELDVLAGNQAALDFWRHVAGEYTLQQFTERPGPEGPRLWFHSR